MLGDEEIFHSDSHVSSNSSYEEELKFADFQLDEENDLAASEGSLDKDEMERQQSLIFNKIQVKVK